MVGKREHGRTTTHQRSAPRRLSPLTSHTHTLGILHLYTMLRQQVTRALRRSTAYPATSSRSFASATASELGPNFNLSDEQQAFQDLARDFTKEQIIPIAAEHDRTMKVMLFARLIPCFFSRLLSRVERPSLLRRIPDRPADSLLITWSSSHGKLSNRLMQQVL